MTYEQWLERYYDELSEHYDRDNMGCKTFDRFLDKVWDNRQNEKYL